ncbi:MAG: pilus assembly protein CpaB [Gaiellales bacterium]|nr:pilus assembly protein CpaB [Gaiellales bacterium]
MNYSIRNLVIAGGLAILAIVAVLIYTSNVKQSAKQGQARVTVYVAKVDVPAGTPANDVIARGDLVQKEVVQDDQLPGVLTATGVIKGMVLKQDLFTGQQVAAAAFVPPSEAATTVAIRGVMRAVSVDVNTSNGLVGTLADGDHVDVFARIGNGDTRFVKKILTNVTVLKPQIGQKDTTGVNNTAHVLFALSDRDAQKMIWLAGNASDDFWLTQRPKENALNSPPSIETLKTLLGQGLPAGIATIIDTLTSPNGSGKVVTGK